MKTSNLLFLFALIFTASNTAYAGSLESLSAARSKGVIQKHMANIQDRVRKCSVVPYTYRNGIKVYHHLLSHCPEVHVVQQGSATVKIGSHVFYVSIDESKMSDGDLFDVRFTEAMANDVLIMTNVHAYGDVLLGILNGDVRGVSKAYVPTSRLGILRDQ